MGNIQGFASTLLNKTIYLCKLITYCVYISSQVPQKPIVRTAAASASTFEVFVDEEESTE